MQTCLLLFHYKIVCITCLQDKPITSYILEQYVTLSNIFLFAYGELKEPVIIDIPYGIDYNQMYLILLHLMSYNDPTTAKQCEHINLFLDYIDLFCTLVCD